MKIVICDDQKAFLDAAKEQILHICQSNRIPASVDCFSDPYLLIDAFNNKLCDYDLVLLDIDMPRMNGKQCAKILREHNKHFKLIFITSYKEEVFTSFEYDISGFIPKTMMKNYLKDELLRVFQKIQDEQEKWLKFDIKSEKEGNCTLKIPVSDILYFESINRKVYLHSLKFVYQIRNLGFENLKKSMFNYDFIEIHRLCIVNLRCIYSVEEEFIVLDNHEELPVSRRNQKSVMGMFSNFIRQELE